MPDPLHPDDFRFWQRQTEQAHDEIVTELERHLARAEQAIRLALEEIHEGHTADAIRQLRDVLR